MLCFAAREPLLLHQTAVVTALTFPQHLALLREGSGSYCITLCQGLLLPSRPQVLKDLKNDHDYTVLCRGRASAAFASDCSRGC